jgi:phosphatidylethanolamine-binding protein (PEBP) family uncharacterized protein
VKRLALFSACALVFVACSRDGRTLRLPKAGQDQTIVTTTAPPSTTAGAGDGAAIINPPRPSLGDPRRVFSAAWFNGEPFPAESACNGVSPELTWANTPGEISEIAVSMVDNDNGDAVHWIVFGISPGTSTMGAGVIPPEAQQTKNYLGSDGWAAPCPNSGTHRYTYTLYFLQKPSGLRATMTAENALATLDLVPGEHLTLSGTATAS